MVITVFNTFLKIGQLIYLVRLAGSSLVKSKLLIIILFYSLISYADLIDDLDDLDELKPRYWI